MTDADPAVALSRRAFLASTAAAGLAGVSRPAAAQRTHTVDMTDDLTFEPDSITVSAGDTVVWENVGRVGHTVTAYGDRIPDGAEYFASGGFDSEGAARDSFPEGDIPGGESYEHTFETPGTYEYFCIPHEGAGMVGTVEVEARQGGGEATPRAPAGGEPILPGGPIAGAVVAATAAVAAIATVYQVFVGGRE